MSEAELMADMMRMMREMLEEVRVDVKSLRVELMQLKNEQERARAKGQYLTMAEACDLLRIGRTTMTERLSQGEYPWAIKRHGKWLFPADKLRLHAAGLA